MSFVHRMGVLVDKVECAVWFVHRMGVLVEKESVSTARREDSPSGMLLPGPTVRSIR